MQQYDHTDTFTSQTAKPEAESSLFETNLA